MAIYNFYVSSSVCHFVSVQHVMVVMDVAYLV